MADYPIPVTGEVFGSTPWPVGADTTPVWDDDEAYNTAYGPVPQWGDDSDATYATTMWHGYVDTQHTGMWAPVYCDIPPVVVPEMISGLTVRIRARTRPHSPLELPLWSGPAIDFTSEQDPRSWGPTVSVLQLTTRDPQWETAGEIVWLSKEYDQENGWWRNLYDFVPSWEPSEQEVYAPAYKWDWVLYDEANNPTTTLKPYARTALGYALNQGCRLVIENPPRHGDNNGVYTERWTDIYKVEITAHSPQITGEPSGDRRAFKGLRR